MEHKGIKHVQAELRIPPQRGSRARSSQKLGDRARMECSSSPSTGLSAQGVEERAAGSDNGPRKRQGHRLCPTCRKTHHYKTPCSLTVAAGGAEGIGSRDEWRQRRELPGPASGNDENEVSKDKNKDDKGGTEKEEDSTVWRTEGSEYIGKKVRRYVLGSHDTADAVVVGWLDKSESDFFAKKTGEPAPLWHVTYDDARLGSENLEEWEVRAAMELLDHQSQLGALEDGE